MMNVASLTHRPKKCEQCGCILDPKKKRVRFCDSCRRKRSVASTREYKRRNPEKVRVWEKRWRSTERGLALRRRNERAYQKRNALKRTAHVKVARAVASGKLTRPSVCSDCGAASLRIEGHHHDY